MRGWIDYYKLLQVDHTAEPEVLEGAYKRLARKYHPDINKGNNAESFMKSLNEAYSILTDPEKRSIYDIEWSYRNKSVQNLDNPASKSAVDSRIAAPALNVLNRYFTSIMGRKFSDAYELVSNADKKQIGPEEFEKWQSTVSKIFNLKLFECEAEKYEKNVRIGDASFKEAIDFCVAVSEHNTVMDRLERDIIGKKVVLEAGSWRIYMGYKEGVGPFIKRLDNISGLLAAKSVMSEFVENYSRIDVSTGLLNRKGFIDLAEKEALRYERYGNIFTLLMFRMNPSKTTGNDMAGAGDNAAVILGKLLAGSLRKLDIVGRWNDSMFITLLPETGIKGGVTAAKKVRKVLDAEGFTSKNRFSVCIGAVEYEGSFESAIKNLTLLSDSAEKRYGHVIITMNGVIS